MNKPNHSEWRSPQESHGVPTGYVSESAVDAASAFAAIRSVREVLG